MQGIEDYEEHMILNFICPVYLKKKTYTYK